MARADQQRRPPRTLRRVEQFPDERSPVLSGVYHLDGRAVVHAHDFLEIAVIVKGAGVHVTASGERSVDAGDFFVLRPGAWHGYAGCRNLVVANCCLSAPALRTELAFLQAFPAVADLLWVAPVARGRYGVHTGRVAPVDARAFAADAHELVALLDRRPRSPVAVAGALLRTLARLVGEPGPADAGGDLSRGGTGSRAVDTVVRAIHEDLTRDWRLGDLAAIAGLDPAYLSRVFRRQFGIAPIGYLARLRAERAAVLLARTGLTVAQVGAAVGWTDPNYFTRRFHALVGVAPTTYREATSPNRPGGDAAPAHSYDSAPGSDASEPTPAAASRHIDEGNDGEFRSRNGESSPGLRHRRA